MIPDLPDQIDPGAALLEIRRLALAINTGAGTAQDAARLAFVASILDQWITNGGILPTQWKWSGPRRSSFARASDGGGR